MLFNSAAVQQLFNSLAVQQRRPHWVQTLRHSLVVQALPKASQNSSTYGHFWLYTSTDSIWFFFVFFCTLTRISALPGSYFYAFKPLVRRRNQECRFVQPRLCWDFVTVRVNNWNDGTIWEFNKPRVNFTPPWRSLLKMPTRYCKQNVKNHENDQREEQETTCTDLYNTSDRNVIQMNMVSLWGPVAALGKKLIDISFRKSRFRMTSISN